MQDAKGRELKVGDVVLVPCKVSRVYDSVDVLQLATLASATSHGRSLVIECVQSLAIRANEGDDTSFRVVQDGDKTILR